MLMPGQFPEEHPWRADGSPPPADHDIRIATAVAQRLSSDWTTRRQQIVVSVQNRVVILTGMVADPDTRQVAGEIAWDTSDVFDVCNALRLSRPRR